MHYWDAPFGLGVEPWDTAEPTPEELQTLLNAFNAVDRSRGSVVVFCCKADSIGKFKAVLSGSAWSSCVQPVY